jgi:hypothetical protein
MGRSVDEEIDRMFRLTDQMATSHSVLRDRYHFYSLIVEVVVLVGSASLTSLAFLDPGILKSLIPHQLPPAIVLAFAGLITFIASIIQLKVDWAGQSALHAKAAEFVFELKHELGRIQVAVSEGEKEALFVPARARYEMIGKLTPPIPDVQFLSLKRFHCLKVEVSKRISEHPGAWPWLMKLRITLADNFGRNSQLRKGRDRP